MSLSQSPSAQAQARLPYERATLALLAILAVYCAVIGGLAAIAPHAFYRHIVGVDRLGPYDEHLVRDVGGLYLGFALIFVWAVLRPSLELVRAACAGFALTEAIHFGYHLANLQPLSSRQVIEQTAGLLPLLVLPIVVLILVRRRAS